MNACFRVESNSTKTLVHRGVGNKFSNYPSACCRQVGGGLPVRGIVSVVVPICCRRRFTLHRPDWKHIQYRSVQIRFFLKCDTFTHEWMGTHTHTPPSDLMLVSLGNLLSCQAAEAVVSTTPGEAWQLLKRSVCVCGVFLFKDFFTSVCFVSAKQIL